MKSRHLVYSSVLSALATLFTGCVGYNTALFMTKSNAGLDFDSKPPTAEINISRKEGVVEPSFESGKTPPVMATFSSKIGSGGGVGRFLFGVDQTFSGGDAAVTMAKLYVSTTVPPDDYSSKTTFDSGLTISKLPKANTQGGKGLLGLKRRLFALAEPGEVRPFFFGTDTQLGVKVGWNGVGGPYPDNLKIGFNRKEMAIAPVTLSPRETNPDGTRRTNVVRIPSFLATVESNVEGAEQVKVGWMQYFATGESANYLARQPGVRVAMAKRADPKSEEESEKLQNYTGTQGSNFNSILVINNVWTNEPAKRPYIHARGVSEGLVPKDTKEDRFMDVLMMIEDAGNPVQSKKLRDLADFSRRPLADMEPAAAKKSLPEKGGATTDPQKKEEANPPNIDPATGLPIDPPGNSAVKTNGPAAGPRTNSPVASPVIPANPNK